MTNDIPVPVSFVLSGPQEARTRNFIFPGCYEYRKVQTAGPVNEQELEVKNLWVGPLGPTWGKVFGLSVRPGMACARANSAPK